MDYRLKANTKKTKHSLSYSFKTFNFAFNSQWLVVNRRWTESWKTMDNGLKTKKNYRLWTVG